MTESQSMHDTSVPSGGAVNPPTEGAGAITKLYYCDISGEGQLDEVRFYNQNGEPLFHLSKEEAKRFNSFLITLGSLFSSEDGDRCITLVEVSSIGDMRSKIKSD